MSKADIHNDPFEKAYTHTEREREGNKGDEKNASNKTESFFFGS